MPAWTIPAGGLHLRRTLDSGQAFRWRWESGPGGLEIATGVIGCHRVRVAQDADGIHLLSPRVEEACRACTRYLGLGPRNAARPALPDVEAALARDRVLDRVLTHTRGTGLLVQDPWEVLISFIVSQNNNIPKISRSIERLAASFGERLGDGVHAFPAVERLARAHPATLRACHLGYRAPYVREAARRVADGRLDLCAVARLPVDEARASLCEVPGIGEKVADCILLFALGRADVFPIDVWVRRAVERLYFRGRPQPVRTLRVFARERFGPLAGYAQQHLYAYARAHLRAAPAARAAAG
jgi:N-glycosylase/DNA lyase